MVWPFPSPFTDSSSSVQNSTETPTQSTPNSAPSTSQTESSKPLTRDELADQELNSFLRELSTDTSPTTPKPKIFTRQPRSPTTPSSSSPSTSDPSPSPSPSPETLQSLLLPQTLSCRTAFDEAFYCNSFGGKFTDLYRHGEFRACSENWSKFWFCMRTRTFSSPQKENEIREFYRKREEGRYGRGRPSSEDVWESRERRVEWGTAFQAAETDKGVGMGMGDEEWNERERARRRAVVEGRS
ncbi:hypothetical protein HYFRA_00003862 [Hymenoscyphus fraxineus]|uniref:Early meiotic induction protein 1 n=1 Tax=Hymenoscyphus fraxineus TaxID=746836 RepID=A0A9N9L0N0_9HELO|nr:hypothetical protein HYFRA_00003862 [Hymenoscyphus fraxineus]